MKNRLKKPSNPEPSTPRQAKTSRHILRLIGFTLGLLILLVLFFLLVVGLPPSLTRRITAQLHAAGIPLQVESIRLSPHHGWVLNNARIYSTAPDDLQPLLTAKKFYVMLWPASWKQPSEGGWHIKIYGKDLGVSLGTPWENVLSEDHPFRTVNRLTASLTAAPGRIAIEKANLDWGGAKILMQGTAVFSATGEPQGEAGVNFRRRIAKAADALSQLKCEQPPELRLDFNFNDTHPEETFLDATLSAEGITWRNRMYKQLAGTLDCRNSVWSLDELRLTQSDNEQLTLRGAINLNTSNAQVSVANTLSAADLFNLFPEEALSAVSQTGIKPFGKLDFTASAGPAPFEQMAEKVDVKMQQVQLKWQKITLDPLALHLTRDGNQIEVTDIRANVNGGPLTGNVNFDMASSAWTARVKTQCDPSLAGAYDEDLRDFLLRFNFPDQYPKADLTLSQTGSGESVVMSGTLSGDNFTCGGVPIDHLETFMTFSNQVVDLTPIHAVRADNQFDGSVQVDFTRQLGIFSATNSFPPGDIARALAPDEHTVLEAFRFDGPVYAAGQGQIDYGTWTNHLFDGTFSAEKISMNKLNADSFTADVQVRGTQLIFTNAVAKLYNGSAEGFGGFDILLEDGSAPYRINARFTNLNLAQMLKQFSSGDPGRTRGELSTTFDIIADAKAGFWESARGAGRIDIQDGHLADVPLFGGFSRLIQSAFAGFNLFSLTAFSADYQLHDSAIWSDNAQLGGTLISARGRGNYSPDKGLNFIVAAEPLRQTGSGDNERSQLQRLAASALKETTAPLFRLLEFQLEGPLEKPEWRFANLPGGRSK